MTILEALVQLRDDIKLWCINNFNHKLNKNLGTEESGKYLVVDENGDVITKTLPTGGTATSADKLNTDAGSKTQPVYFSGGIPVGTTHTLNATVPSNAVFTDTVYTHPTYTSQNAGLYKISVDETGHVNSASAVTKSDITALGIPGQNTTYSTADGDGLGLVKSGGDVNVTDGIIYINKFNRTLSFLEQEQELTTAFDKKPHLMCFSVLDVSAEIEVIASGCIPYTLFSGNHSYLLECPVRSYNETTSTHEYQSLNILLSYNKTTYTFTLKPVIIPNAFQDHDLEFEIFGF